MASAKELCGFKLNGSKAKGAKEACDVAVVIKTDEKPFVPHWRKIIEQLTDVPKRVTKAMIEFMFSEDLKTAKKSAAPKKAGGTAIKQTRGVLNDSLCAPRTQ